MAFAIAFKMSTQESKARTPKQEGNLMTKWIPPPTDIRGGTARPAEKPQKLFDGCALFLPLTPTGGKL